jgi:CRISPR-associated protein Csb2
VNRHLVLSIRFLDDRYHGLTDNGEKPEWPPSPFRLFQAIVAGSARGGAIPEQVREALMWLESLDPPEIVAPAARKGTRLLTYVLNNVSDTQPNSRTPKILHPTLLNGDRLVQYVWRLDHCGSNPPNCAEQITKAVQHINAVGWGIDLAVGCGELLAHFPQASGHRSVYRPLGNADSRGASGGIDLRVPRPGSLTSLERTYADFLRRFETPGIIRLESSGTIYAPQRYVLGECRPCTSFSLRRGDDDRLCSIRHQLVAQLAGMVRGLAAKHVERVASKDIANADVLGHPQSELISPDRVSILPLPTVRDGPTDGRIRRVMLAEPFGSDGKWCRLLGRLLDGQLLVPSAGEDRFPAMYLERIDRHDNVLPRYTAVARCWASVTPVLLPGFDDRKQHRGDHLKRLARAELLLSKALCHCGIDVPCVFEISKVPYVGGTLHARDYQPRHKLQHYPRYHVRIEFNRPVTGPLAIGAGRHCGFGILATVSD